METNTQNLDIEKIFLNDVFEMVEKALNLFWVNFNGRKEKLANLSHQHISNIYWYNKIVVGETNNNIFFIIKNIIKKNFNDVVLPYSPESGFQNEILFLNSNGFLFFSHVEGDNQFVYDIMYDGDLVGQVKNNGSL